jgi:phage repressor protein C with HTH and peptisase S24 domain
MTTLAERIVTVRKRIHKRTQEEFAVALGLGRASVANWERGGHVSGDNLIKISDTEGVSLDWLRTGEGEMTTGSGMIAAGNSPGRGDLAVDVARQNANASIVKTLPVLAAQDIGGGYMQVMKTNVIERIPMPPALSERARAYALLVPNNAMAPAFRYGDIAWIDPMMPYAPDTEAVFYKANGDGADGEVAILGTLIAVDGLHWTIEILKPEAQQIKLKRKDWPTSQRVVGKTARR